MNGDAGCLRQNMKALPDEPIDMLAEVLMSVWLTSVPRHARHDHAPQNTFGILDAARCTLSQKFRQTDRGIILPIQATRN